MLRIRKFQHLQVICIRTYNKSLLCESKGHTAGIREIQKKERERNSSQRKIHYTIPSGDKHCPKHKHHSQ